MGKPAKLTPKQHAFVTWYCSAAVNFNATEAARRAGYKGNDTTLQAMGAENLRKPLIAVAIAEATRKALAGADVTIESTLRHLSVMREEARAAGQYSAAIRATELQGKYLKMFVDRIEHVTPVEDMSDVELEAMILEALKEGNINVSKLVAGLAATSPPGAAAAGKTTTH